jgi:ribosomal protein S27E
MSTEQKTSVHETGFLPHDHPEKGVKCERCGKGRVVWDAELEKSACERCGKVYAPPSV